MMTSTPTTRPMADTDGPAVPSFLASLIKAVQSRLRPAPVTAEAHITRLAELSPHLLDDIGVDAGTLRPVEGADRTGDSPILSDIAAILAARQIPGDRWPAILRNHPAAAHNTATSTGSPTPFSVSVRRAPSGICAPAAA